MKILVLKVAMGKITPEKITADIACNMSLAIHFKTLEELV